jgi:hypothetical protein
MSVTRLLIVASDAESAKAYADAVASSDAAYDVAASFTEMAEMATHRRYNGLLVDVLTLVRCTPEEKAIAYESINLFPVMRVRWNKNVGKLQLSPLEAGYPVEPEPALRMFIETRCRTFKAKSLRKHKRRTTTLNLVFSAGEPGAGEEVKSFSINISVGGAFVHTMKIFQEGTPLWLRLIHFNDQTPIPATVRWSQPWGLSSSIPGVGISFDSLTKEQEQELKALLNL